jgi:hypothetical protein
VALLMVCGLFLGRRSRLCYRLLLLLLLLLWRLRLL